MITESVITNYIARVIILIDEEGSGKSMKIRFPNMTFRQAEFELLSVLGSEVRARRAQIVSLKHETPRPL